MEIQKNDYRKARADSDFILICPECINGWDGLRIYGQSACPDCGTCFFCGEKGLYDSQREEYYCSLGCDEKDFYALRRKEQYGEIQPNESGRDFNGGGRNAFRSSSKNFRRDRNV
jgi:hypothetical protein